MDKNGSIDFEEFVAIFVQFHDGESSATSHFGPTSNQTDEAMNAPAGQWDSSSSSYEETTESEQPPMSTESKKEEDDAIPIS